jgi:IclR family transcriptional regulator, KDG regulon repressor
MQQRGRLQNEDQGQGRRASARSVEQTLDALELLSGADEPVGVTGVANSLGISAAGAHRLLDKLTERGYARQDPDIGKYCVGPRCFSLATLAPTHRALQVVAADHMTALNELTGETVHLAIYDNGQVIYIDKRESRRPIAPITRVGTIAPAHCVATGRAILAHLAAAEVESLLESGLEQFNDATIVSRSGLFADLSTTRRRGYAVNDGTWREDVCGVAAPVRDYTGTVQGSVGCCVPRARFEQARDDLAHATVAKAIAISEELGFVMPVGTVDADDPKAPANG